MADRLYDRKTFLLKDPGPMQMSVLDMYRLSDEFRHVYGSKVLRGGGRTVQDALDAVAKFKGEQYADIETSRQLLEDLIYSRYVLGFKHWEYFAYGLDQTTIEQRIEFLPEDSRDKYRAVLNPDLKACDFVSRKSRTYQVIPELYKRDVIKAGSGTKFEDFKMFCLRNRKFIAKPDRGSLGKNSEIIDTAGFSHRQLLLLFRRLSGDKNGMCCEGLITQDDRMAAIHPESVNTIRVTTYLALDGSVRMICAYLRSGRGESIVDNAGAGGVFAAVDVENWVVSTNAVAESGESYVSHPDTGFVFKGFQMPERDLLAETAAKAAKAFPVVRFIGWDMALSKNNGWVVVEGNAMPQLNVLQIATKTGIRGDFERIVEWEENRRRAKT